MDSPESTVVVEPKIRPSFIGVFGATIGALRNYHRQEGVSEERINYMLRDISHGDPKKFPPDQEFPMETLNDDAVTFLAINTPEKAPYKKVFSDETLKRGLTRPLENPVPPTDLVEQITYKVGAK